MGMKSSLSDGPVDTFIQTMMLHQQMKEKMIQMESNEHKKEDR